MHVKYIIHFKLIAQTFSKVHYAGHVELYFESRNRKLCFIRFWQLNVARLLATGASGGFRTWRSVSLKHMVPTHKTTLLPSNCPGIDVIPAGVRDNSGLCVCQCFRPQLPAVSLLTSFIRCGFCLGRL